MSQTEVRNISSKKKKTQWSCIECGHMSTGYLGKCPTCHAWNTFKEEEVYSEKELAQNKPKNALFISPEAELMTLDEIPESEISRFNTGYDEFDRVLGGGVVPGSLILLGGSPGIGKSTILLQTAANLGRGLVKQTENCQERGLRNQAALKVFYVSAEESSQQLKLRASRLGLGEEKIHVYAENNLEKIVKKIKDTSPDLVIVDSIQAIYMPALDSIPGSVTQIRETTSNLMRLAKATDIPIFVVGHINKDGDIAGPKILEHMVDTVLYFEGERDSNFRILRSIKNRFGSTDEVGLFDMTAKGLVDLKNPSELFLKERSGGVVFASREGNRSLLIELQSLIIGSDYNHPRRITNGTDTGRLHQILAVMEKKLGFALSKSDVYMNVVGGLKIKDPAADLAIALSIFQSANQKKDSEPRDDLIALGEIGLMGEIRAISNLDSRLKEAEKLGFKKAIIPKSNNYKGKSKMQIISARNLEDAINSVIK